MMCEICDIRDESDFKTYTFSKYKRSEVRKQLIESLRLSKIEAACFWSAEMLCSGHSADMWEAIILFYTKYVHLGNHKLCILLNKRLQYFKHKMNVLQNNLDIRNDITSRQMISELITLLAVSKKKMRFERVDIISKEASFNMLDIKENLLAPANKTFFEISEDDSLELRIPMNEFAFCLSQKNTQQAMYWIEWLLEYEIKCKKEKKITLFKLKRRPQVGLLSKYEKDLVWIIWECLEKFLNDTNYLKELFGAALSLFVFHYTTTVCKKRIFLLFFVCAVITETVDVNEKLLDEVYDDIVENVKKNINGIYKQIKASENFKALEYLTTPPTNKTQTIEKLKTMEEFKFIPRFQEP